MVKTVADEDGKPGRWEGKDSVGIFRTACSPSKTREVEKRVDMNILWLETAVRSDVFLQARILAP